MSRISSSDHQYTLCRCYCSLPHWWQRWFFSTEKTYPTTKPPDGYMYYSHQKLGVTTMGYGRRSKSHSLMKKFPLAVSRQNNPYSSVFEVAGANKLRHASMLLHLREPLKEQDQDYGCPEGLEFTLVARIPSSACSHRMRRRLKGSCFPCCSSENICVANIATGAFLSHPLDRWGHS